LDQLDGYLEHLAREVAHPGYGELLGSLLTDEPLRQAWRTAPCTCSAHHAYLGGLLEHTVAVATLALEACSLHPAVNSDLLITAAIVHDLGLTRAFTYSAAISDSPAGRMVGHLELGLEVLREHGRRVGLARQDWQPLAHCVLTHHGPRPVWREYACAEAVALQRLVALDEGVKRALDGEQML
jgi:3'-5' exoribonuclease